MPDAQLVYRPANGIPMARYYTLEGHREPEDLCRNRITETFENPVLPGSS